MHLREECGLAMQLSRVMGMQKQLRLLLTQGLNMQAQTAGVQQPQDAILHGSTHSQSLGLTCLALLLTNTAGTTSVCIHAMQPMF